MKGKTELRRAVDELHGLPVLPRVAGEVLTAAGRKLSPPSDLAPLFLKDPALTASALRLSASSPFEHDTVRFEDRLRGLDQAALTGLVFDSVVGNDPAQSAEYLRFGLHSLACALLASHLADQVGGVDRETAYLAGLLHDIGRLVLLQSADPEYAHILHQARHEQSSLLTLERQLLEVDHTVVGKWVAEKWRFPAPLVQAIWFHHHPLGILDGTIYPVRLIDVIAVANAMSHTLPGAGDGQSADLEPSEARLARLGLVAADLGVVREKAALDLSKHLDLFRPLADRQDQSRALRRVLGTALHSGEGLSGQVQSLRRTNQAYRVLHELNVRATPGLPLNELLDLCAQALRSGLEAESGVCLIADPSGAFVYGKTWTALDSEIDDLFVHLESGESSGVEGLPEEYQRTLNRLLPGAEHKTWEGAALREPAEQDGLHLAPMSAGSWHVGLVLLPSPCLAGLEPNLASLYANACAAAVLRHRAEEHLRDEAEELASALGAHGATPTQEQRLAAEPPAHLAHMAAGAAHAINNPLTVIAGQAQILLNRLSDPADIRTLTSIIQNTRRASSVLLDLLTFAKPPAPKLEPCLLNFLLHQALEGELPRLKAKNITVNEDYAEGLPRVLIDRRQLDQMLARLLRNAEDAIGANGGRIAIQTRAGEKQGSVRVCVTDTGRGIAPELMTQVFEPFFTTHSRGERSGLGLTVCQALAAQHNGTLLLSSHPGQGTTATLEFPAMHEPAAQPSITVPSPEKPAAAPPPPSTPPARKEHPVILVVDDDEDLRHVIGETLRHRGYDVRTAADGYEALGVVAANAVDLVLLDMHMPRKNGLAVLHDLSTKFAGLPIMVMSGFMSDEEAAEVLRLGARSCLRKPFRVERLLAEIDEVFIAPSR